ncbi:MAG: MAPEG family protein [Hyphomonadaceae bacterium]
MPAPSAEALAPLILYALWAVALQFRLAFARQAAMRSQKRAINTFKAMGDDEALDRVSRAHLNTVENLPVFAVTYLAALWTGAAAPIIALGWTAFGARAVQSLTHLSSTSVAAVRLRALMQLVGIVCFIWLGVSALLTLS